MKKVKICRYNAIFQEEKEGGYSVWVPALPGCCSQGETLEEAVANIKEAITLYLESKSAKNPCYSKTKEAKFAIPITVSYA